MEIKEAIRIVRAMLAHSARGTFPGWSRKRHEAIATVLERVEFIDRLSDDDIPALAEIVRVLGPMAERVAATYADAAFVASTTSTPLVIAAVEAATNTLRPIAEAALAAVEAAPSVEATE